MEVKMLHRALWLLDGHLLRSWDSCEGRRTSNLSWPSVGVCAVGDIFKGLWGGKACESRRKLLDDAPDPLAPSLSFHSPVTWTLFPSRSYFFPPSPPSIYFPFPLLPFSIPHVPRSSFLLPLVVGFRNEYRIAVSTRYTLSCKNDRCK